MTKEIQDQAIRQLIEAENALLAAFGWTVGPDGLWYSPEGYDTDRDGNPSRYGRVKGKAVNSQKHRLFHGLYGSHKDMVQS